MNKKLHKEEPRTFPTLTKDEVQSVDVLQNTLMNLPIIVLPPANGQYTIYTDACDKQVGYVLLHTQEDVTDRPIGYR